LPKGTKLDINERLSSIYAINKEYGGKKSQFVQEVGRDWNQLLQDIKEIWEFAREIKGFSAG